jgi:hypothetical protein
MKVTYLPAIALALLCISCQNPKNPIEKTWVGQSIDFSQLKEVTNTYYMYDSTGVKVGSMIFGLSFENGFLVARDTSQFDDGSVYETAEFNFDTTDFRMNKVSTDMKTARAVLDIDLSRVDDKLRGTYVLKRDTITRTFEIDSAYQFTNFREEIYMMIQALSIKPKDSIALQSMVSTSMTVSKGLLIHSGVETIETLNGMESCDVIWLKADGKMPDNKIWVTKKSPRTIVKFYIPGAELNIVLESFK